MQRRELGRTGLQSSIVGFGGTWISELSIDEAVKVVRRAFDLGINYFDTAKLDGDSEEKIGIALKDVRDKIILATKTASRTRSESLADFKNSLTRLKTDKLDIIQLHGIDDEKTLSKAMSSNGSLEMCKRARSEGLVDFIGITSHKPRVLIKAIMSNEFDTILVPINIVTRQALQDLIPLAKELDIGICAMKPFSAKTSTLITCLYNPSLSLFSDESQLKTWLGSDNFSIVSNLIGFVLEQRVSVVVTGFKSVKEVEVATQVGEQYNGFSEDQKSLFGIDFDKGYCQDCGLCLPCPERVDIASILRFHSLYDVYGLKNWGRNLYEGLDVDVERCTECGECEPKCPYHLPIMSMLQKAGSDFQR